MTESNANLNGHPHSARLHDQLDRLDGVIDLLADNLNRAVADAVRAGADAAVRAAVRAVLSDPYEWTRLARAVIAGVERELPSAGRRFR